MSEALRLPGGMAVSFEEKGARDGRYPPEWPMIAYAIKCMAGWKCERCQHPHGPVPWVLTVHHLDWNKWNMEHWNLAALCQRCHLRIQARIPEGMFYQDYWLPHSPWMAVHVIDYNEWAARQDPPRVQLKIVSVDIERLARSYVEEWE